MGAWLHLFICGYFEAQDVSFIIVMSDAEASAAETNAFLLPYTTSLCGEYSIMSSIQDTVNRPAAH